MKQGAKTTDKNKGVFIAAEIKSCDCVHKGQDRLYGKGYRLHNYARKKDMWRCSVCGKEKK